MFWLFQWLRKTGCICTHMQRNGWSQMHNKGNSHLSRLVSYPAMGWLEKSPLHTLYVSYRGGSPSVTVYIRYERLVSDRLSSDCSPTQITQVEKMFWGHSCMCMQNGPEMWSLSFAGVIAAHTIVKPLFAAHTLHRGVANTHIKRCLRTTLVCNKRSSHYQKKVWFHTHYIFGLWWSVTCYTH